MQNEYEIKMQSAFAKYAQAEREWLISVHRDLPENKQDEAYKNLCFYREEYRKIVNE